MCVNTYEVYDGKKLVARGHGAEIAPLVGLTTKQLGCRLSCASEATLNGLRVVVANRARPPKPKEDAYERWDRMTAYYRKLWGIPRSDGGKD